MHKEITLGGGCFWGMEELFRKQPGVTGTEVGYAGGENVDPTYENHPGHAEVLKITYDTGVTNLENIFHYFFKIHDPTTKDRQGNDTGTSYRSVIFYVTGEQKQTAEKIIAEINASRKWENPVTTTLEPLKNYNSAEEEHQDYLQKNPHGYTCHFER
ncbi:peptide-methionine (S)-S-oxide reductase [Candidatus Kaiserbacteria bacterium RIFCSPHIGHO2_02_FULL_50_50]|uniref:Peptide methionine sulfoxide reductase MsrA n=1 Tax=Candidatus Kaiserbacteria bacterium RIFCSPHIGHO2_02_FULL_50_50 TaxID=1798492 RepID=A0A1F6DEV7_9BACT|nr:MAG: peptide-methionine (S)-S-oxide reductase [Candidatus Kaiserbacteria bacterium RIFCSPHIGHO2_02_FULL_50_50]OGG88732.1 MAG: peptide-methionine (S)-S-oxide reductase [Candidatus Kaiserbacteria bacterium RIFCSPLOWO2_12_FULL_50_10]